MFSETFSLSIERLMLEKDETSPLYILARDDDGSGRRLVLVPIGPKSGDAMAAGDLSDPET
jgi:hypothetical protein